MILTDWLRRLERLHYKAIDMGLERVSRVAQQSDLLADLPYIITIGGTNGKGSTVAFLESILRTAGYKVGTYTSPHLIDFNERVRIDGANVDDQSLVSAFELIEKARGDVSLTYFEFTTLAAMHIFKQCKLDVILLEVGLGGRLDAVNIWDADIAAVTSIDLDHQQFLGDTREKVGLEKIGIGRAGKPLVVGEPQIPELVLSAVNSLGLQLFRLNEQFQAESSTVQNLWCFRGIDPNNNAICLEHLPATALYHRNAAVALQILVLSPFMPDITHIRRGLAQAGLTGRQQIVQDAPMVMLDVGHNPHAAAHLAQRLRSLHPQSIHCIIGMLKDKSVANTLAELLDVIDCWHPVTLGGERGQEGTVIADELVQAGARVDKTWSSPHQAYSRLVNTVSSDELILVFGSFYTVADVIQYRQSVSREG